ncbi:surface antigen, partial [Plasmodium falciparum UGT5.1]
VNTHKKPHTTARHTQKIPTTRSLSECELYAPVNYYSDPQMKEVMDNFNKQTQQRFHEYDERMKTTRQKCKDKCDKEIQKIILKDKIEKELAETFSSLHTDIQSDAIPTCVCEKSMADKVEKGCLRCGSVLGGGVMPGLGLIGGTAVYAAAVNAATKAGMKAALEGLKRVPGLSLLLHEKINDLVTTTNFKCPNALMVLVQNVKDTQCVGPAAKSKLFCNGLHPQNVSRIIDRAAEAGREGADVYITTFSDSTTITTFLTDPIVISAIVVISIVVILLIIYLILRYRRKIKMNKKLQYIKLLKE